MIRKPKRKTFRRFGEPTKCRFCRMGIEHVDYKDIQSLQKLTTVQGKMFSRKRSGNCAKHQRSVKKAVKRARYLALLPYMGR
ncbi:MAG: 30S ribosomal protein S18 [Planctomycetota bacterium]